MHNIAAHNVADLRFTCTLMVKRTYVSTLVECTAVLITLKGINWIYLFVSEQVKGSAKYKYAL